jgi:DNA-binding CsgD family transcriptional regulator
MPDAAIRETELAADAVTSGGVWDRGGVAVWLLRTGSTRVPDSDVAEPYRLELENEPVKAADLWTRLDCPYDAALALAGAPGEADQLRALQIFNGLGASATARVVRNRLRRQGVRSIPAGPRASTRAHPSGLTRREREVLDLICAALTNAEIGKRLFISPKTVDHHVSAILAKLGVPTRTAAAHRAAELGLVDLGEPAGERY